MSIEASGQRSRGLIAAVSGNFFDELGARPAIGRLLSTADLAEPSPDPLMVAVLGHAYWQRAFGGDPAVIGQRVVIEGVPLEIVGVSPYDAATLLTAIVVLAAVAGVASLLPAWRAARADPASVLRTT